MSDVMDAELAEAKRRWEAERAERPVATAVRFDAPSERVVVDFTNRASFLFPARALEDLQDATIEQLMEVELLGETGLHWESLDAHYTISGLMSGIYGTKSFMDAQRRGGQSAHRRKSLQAAQTAPRADVRKHPPGKIDKATSGRPS